MPIGSQVINLIFLIGSIRLFTASKSPFIASSAYAFVLTIVGFSFGDRFAHVLIASIGNFGFTYLYFRLLRRYEGYWLFWAVLAVGIFIPFWDLIVQLLWR